ncbi:Amine oxidase [flavin-containing] [Colletotrichum gloeosporioides]|uniref:monoamine oxidase n=1 Tax=Colletotrichum gloeosporioides TaxID=474922 RepID=A0A8H4CI32_COLGL|nr:Amine oxidase [flavin-containing] [Colletotrichum gloeosporioides]KAF3804142.1 Amine oxidase [flavin-containing] [Colletotrichum gloeosporioides]
MNDVLTLITGVSRRIPAYLGALFQGLVGGFVPRISKTPAPMALSNGLDDKQEAQHYDAFGQTAVIVDCSNSEQPWLRPDAKRLNLLTLAELGEKEIGDGIGSVVLNVLSRACLGLESSEVGALPVIDYIKAGTGLENISSDLKDGAQYLRNRQEKEWTKDPWARGAPCPVMGPGVLTSDAGKAVREPVSHIHFIGTETSLVWKGYMEGAVQAGIRGAKEVIADLAE